ncbi:MAG: hypothetical protein ACTS3F_11825, partial [Phycisphaerales bacterium]
FFPLAALFGLGGVGGAGGGCPECGGVVSFARAPRRFEVCRCAGCGAELEVTGVSPLVLAVAPEIEEDWGE